MEKNVAQHKLFGPGLAAFDGYIAAVRERKQKFDGTKVLSIIDSFGEVLVQHLADEIVVIEGLNDFEGKIDWKDYNKKVMEKVVDAGDTVSAGGICIDCCTYEFY